MPTNTPVLYSNGAIAFIVGSLPETTIRLMPGISETGALEKFASVTGQALWEWDLETGKVRQSGKGFYRAFGLPLTEKDLNCRTCLVHPEDAEKVTLHYKHALKNPDLFATEIIYRARTADGTFAYVSDKALIYRNPFGRPFRVYGASCDVTVQRNREAERESLFRELTQNNLDLKQLSYFASHNLRTPVARSA